MTWRGFLAEERDQQHKRCKLHGEACSINSRRRLNRCRRVSLETWHLENGRHSDGLDGVFGDCEEGALCLLLLFTNLAKCVQVLVHLLPTYADQLDAQLIGALFGSRHPRVANWRAATHHLPASTAFPRLGLCAGP